MATDVRWTPWVFKTPDSTGKFPASAPANAFAFSESCYGYRYRLRESVRHTVTYDQLRVGHFYSRVDIGSFDVAFPIVELFHIERMDPSGSFQVLTRFAGRHTITRRSNRFERFHDYSHAFVEAYGNLWFIKPDGCLVPWKTRA